MSEGATMVSLDESLKILKCGLQNEIVLESTSDITIIIQRMSRLLIPETHFLKVKGHT